MEKQEEEEEKFCLKKFLKKTPTYSRKFVAAVVLATVMSKNQMEGRN